MKLLDLTLDLPAANIALDEALLDQAENGNNNEQVLRLWEPEQPIVVLGRSSKIAREVDTQACKSANIPIIRRCSGGATILTAPGCLMYAVLLSYDKLPRLRALDAAHEFVITQVQQAISSRGITTEFQGTSDLTIGGRKVSGNALRCKRKWLVYHGTLICEGMDRELISRCLRRPIREPEYRQGRSHNEFLTQIPDSPQSLANAMQNAWNAGDRYENWPKSLTDALVESKYSLNEWNAKI